MKNAAHWFVASAFLGASVLSWPETDSPMPVPLPGKDLTVRIAIERGEAGSYRVEVDMPEAPPTVDFVEETVPCNLLIEVDPGQKWQQIFTPTSVQSFAEYGYANVKYYHAGPAFDLDGRDHEVRVSAPKGCPVAAERGATVEVTKDVGEPTGHLLKSALRYWTAVVALFGGLLGVTIVVLRKQPAAA